MHKLACRQYAQASPADSMHEPARSDAPPDAAAARPSLFAVELRTSRWAELVAWYRDVLGLRVLVRVVDDGYALLAAGDTRLALVARADPPLASGRWSLAFEVAALDDVHARLVTRQAAVSPPTTHPEGYRECVVTDPDGNRLRLFAWP
jgi:catechol 2,3-dioxygenase-like lactoylglutathione lyase family enzyme